MKIIITNIYFGKKPQYFDLFLMSCAANKRFDFIFFTDFDFDKQYPNIRHVKLSWKEIRELFQSKFDFEISLTSPYKLCDYRPAYGHIFSSYFDGYDWWGHCDFDMIFGNLSPVFDIAESGQFVKIFRRGHLSLYKNTDSINSVYL